MDCTYISCISLGHTIKPLLMSLFNHLSGPLISLSSKPYHFQISHQRLVLMRLGLIANNIKRIPTPNRAKLRMSILCVFVIMVNRPSCDHVSQTPTIASNALMIRFILFLLTTNIGRSNEKSFGWAGYSELSQAFLYLFSWQATKQP